MSKKKVSCLLIMVLLALGLCLLVACFIDIEFFWFNPLYPMLHGIWGIYVPCVGDINFDELENKINIEINWCPIVPGTWLKN